MKNRPVIAKTFLVGFLIISLAVCASILLRKDNFGRAVPGHAEYITAHTIFTAGTWYDHGITSEHGLSYFNPPGVEIDSLNSRGVYTSYPSGTYFPLYIMSRILQIPPNEALAHGYALFIHLAVAYLLFAGCYIAAESCGSLDRLLVSISPALIWLFLKSPLLWLQNSLFADQAVILPFAIFSFVWLVTKINEDRLAGETRWLYYLQAIVVFWGVSTDWLFVPLVGVALLLDGFLYLFLNRLKNKPLQPIRPFLSRIAISYAIPGGLALLLFGFQLYGVMDWSFIEPLRGNARYRSGAGLSLDHFWNNNFVLNYGAFSPYILGAGLFLGFIFSMLTFRAFLRMENRGAFFGLLMTALVTGTCFLHLHLLRQHSSIHDFSTVKFGLPLSLLLGFVLPLTLIQLTGSKRMVLMMLTLIAGWLVYQTKLYTRVQAGEFVGQQYELIVSKARRDSYVLISDIFTVDSFNVSGPMNLRWAKQRVYDSKNESIMLLLSEKPKVKGFVLISHPEVQKIKLCNSRPEFFDVWFYCQIERASLFQAKRQGIL